MTASNVIPFPRTRILRTKLRMVQYDDVRVEFARRVEERLIELETMASVYAGERPSDTEGAS